MWFGLVWFVWFFVQLRSLKFINNKCCLNSRTHSHSSAHNISRNAITWKWFQIWRKQNNEQSSNSSCPDLSPSLSLVQHHFFVLPWFLQFFFTKKICFHIITSYTYRWCHWRGSAFCHTHTNSHALHGHIHDGNTSTWLKYSWTWLGIWTLMILRIACSHQNMKNNFWTEYAV